MNAAKNEKTVKQTGIATATAIFADNGGTLSTMKAIRLGIHPEILYRMRNEGVVIQIGRGLYRLAKLPPLKNPDLIAVALKAPKAVICLISALSFHELTMQIPHEVSIALRPGYKPPRLSHPPIRAFYFSAGALSEGIQRHEIDGISVQIFSPEKTIADCFKFRNKIGNDVAIESLKIYRRRKGASVDEILKYARICRVEEVMQPYLETAFA